MTSLRTRVFVTVAVVLAGATLASGLLSRRATLIEERQIVGTHRRPSVDGLDPKLQQAYVSDGWTGVRIIINPSLVEDARLLVLDGANRTQAAFPPALSKVTVTAADAAGNISLVNDDNATHDRVEMRGVPTVPIRDATGAIVGRLYVLPLDAPVPFPRERIVPDWITMIVVTALVALLLTFMQSSRLLRPIGDLTNAARKMREGDLAVRVAPRGDDEIARLGRAFNEMAERLAQTETLKRQMVGDVAHELRSPVTNLRCGLEAIQDGLVAPDRDRIDALHSETLLLQRLIADLQDLALADSGGLALVRQPVDLAAIVRRAIGPDPSGAAVHVSIDAAAAQVTGDAGRLEQMLRNVISNARRHTPVDGRIEIRAARDDGGTRIAVADTGRGIAAEHLPHVFDRFYRADPSRDRATGGAGLGLAIVRRLAEAHGGTVIAESEGENRGTKVTITIPDLGRGDTH
ncbi:MAG TPA: ATP-binding protein [Vicinamibacterales bacterium]|nr:ATP-binding protein [Vicinamibacterales bacterium]